MIFSFSCLGQQWEVGVLESQGPGTLLSMQNTESGMFSWPGLLFFKPE